MSPLATSPLQKYLELYLTQEGLYSAIPEHRSKSIFTLPAGRVGLLLLIITEFLFLSLFSGTLEWLASLTIVFISLVAAILTVFIVMVYQFLKTKKTFDRSQTSLLGGIMIGVLSLVLIIANGYYLNSWLASAIFVPCALLSFVIFALLNQFYHRVHSLFGALRSVLTSAVRSIQLIIVILPLMLILILFSVFSGEFWQAIGSINVVRLLFGIAILLIPTLLLSFTTVPKLTKGLIEQAGNEFFRTDLVASLSEINKPLSKGVISKEEWQTATSQLSWMHKDKILDDLSFVEKRLKSSFSWLLLFTAIFIVLGFAVYFYILFKVLVTSEQIAEWTGIPLAIVPLQVPLGSNYLALSLYSTDFALAKVSLFLAAFVSTVAIVQSLTDESFRSIFTEQLTLRISRWVTAASLYKAVSTPGYQLWSVIRPPKTPRATHVIIVVPKPSLDGTVKIACEHIRGRFDVKSYNVLRIIAYEQKDTDAIYDIGVPGRKWIYIHNSINNTVSFYDNHTVIAEEPSTDHNLGDSCIATGTSIPNRWYSNQEEGVKIGELLWDTDEERQLILHPRISINEGKIVAHIHLRRRFESSEEYKEITKKVYTVINNNTKFSLLLLSLTFRDTLDRLATLDFNEQVVTYYDHVSGKHEYFSHTEWHNNI